MQIKLYEPREVGPQQSSAVGALPGERRTMPSFPVRNRAWAGVGEIGRTLDAIGKQVQQAAEVQEFSEAMVKSTSGMADIYERIRADETLADATVEELEQVFTDLSGDLREDIASGIKEHRAKKAFIQKYSEDDLRGRLKIRDMGRQRFVSRSRASTDQQLQSLSDNLIRSGDLDSIAKGQAIIDGKVSAGIFTAEEGRQLSQRFRQNAVVGYYERLIENPRTAPAAYQELVSDPEALSFVDERTKSALIQRARTAATKATEDAYELAVLSDLRGRFDNDPIAAMEHLEDPANFRALTFEGRTRLISYLGAVATRDRLQAEAARKARANNERIAIYAATLRNELGKAAELTMQSGAIDAKDKIAILESLRAYPWKTSPDVYSDVVSKIHSGIITEPDQVDRLRGRGLSNGDADKLKGKLDKPKYKETLDYAESAFKLLYPAKDDLDRHMRHVEFVQQVESDISARNAERAQAKKQPISSIEAREIVDSYLQQVEQPWYKSDYRPVERWMEGKPAFESGEKSRERPRIPAFERTKMNYIPRETQEKIADILFENGYTVNAQSIMQFYKMNMESKDDTQRANQLPINF